MQLALIHDLRGKNVVVDDTNFAPCHESARQKLAQDIKADFEVEFFDTP